MQSRNNDNLRIYRQFSWKQLIKVVHQYVIKGTDKSQLYLQSILRY